MNNQNAYNALRIIENEDYNHNYEELFSTLTKCTALQQEEFAEIIATRAQQGWQTWVLDAHRNGKKIIIATISILIERKFYRGGKNVGHVEDVIVLPEYQHHKIGLQLMNHAIHYAKQHNCYKLILDCKESLYDFYKLLELTRSNIQMALYFQ